MFPKPRCHDCECHTSRSNVFIHIFDVEYSTCKKPHANRSNRILWKNDPPGLEWRGAQGLKSPQIWAHGGASEHGVYRKISPNHNCDSENDKAADFWGDLSKVDALAFGRNDRPPWIIHVQKKRRSSRSPMKIDTRLPWYGRNLPTKSPSTPIPQVGANGVKW